MNQLKSCADIVRFVLASLAILCTILSFIGNLTLILTIFRLRSLRTNLNLLVLGVTAADILSVLSSQPMDIVYMIKFPIDVFTTAGYIIWDSLYYSYLTISAYGLCAINVDRFIAVLYPLRYSSMITHKVICRVILSYWLYGAITFAFLTYLQYVEVADDCKLASVTLLPNEWLLLIFIVNVFLPGSISFIASVYVTQVTWKHRKQIYELDARLRLSALEARVQPGPINSYSTDDANSLTAPPLTSQRSIALRAISTVTALGTSQRINPSHVFSRSVITSRISSLGERNPTIPTLSHSQWKRGGLGHRITKFNNYADENEHSQDGEENQLSIYRLSRSVLAISRMTMGIFREVATSFPPVLCLDLQALRTFLGALEALLLLFYDENNVNSTDIIEIRNNFAIQQDQLNSETNIPMLSDSDRRKQHIVLLRNCIAFLIFLKSLDKLRLEESVDVSSKGSTALHAAQTTDFVKRNVQNRFKIDTAKRRSMITTLKTSRLVLCLSLTFLVCTFPYILMEIYRRYSADQKICNRPCSSEVIRMGLWWLSYWNSVTNVFCYVIMNKELRTALKRSIRTMKTRLLRRGSFDL